jgi:hypothetical protein
MVGPWQQPVAYLSKCLDPVASGWPPCLWALVATVTLIREADKSSPWDRTLMSKFLMQS